MVPPETFSEQNDAASVRESVSAHSVVDQPTAKDELGFSPYVAALAAFLLHDETHAPLTLSIEGPWGAGKSSFMLQLQERIGGAPKPGKTVWFNVWHHMY